MSSPLRPARRSLRAILLVLALGVLAGAIASCGGGSNESASAAGSDEAAEQDAARLKLEQCLEDQGIEAPRSGPGPNSQEEDRGGGPSQVRPSQAEMAELQEALEGPCKQYRDEAFGEITEEDRQEFEDARVKFESCLKKEGVDIESESDGGMQTFRIEGDDSETQEAMEKCRKLLPDRGGGGPGLRLGTPPGGGGGDGD